jgi:hypothetical protein
MRIPPKRFLDKVEKMMELQQEFEDLKAELFPDRVQFVAVEESEDREKWARYQQLLGFFVPCFRNDVYKNPMLEEVEHV